MGIVNGGRPASQSLVLTAAVVWGMGALAALAGCRNEGGVGRSVTSGAASSGALEPIAFETVEQGDQSGVDQPEAHLITSAAAWQALWARHSHGLTAAPAIDFSREAVVAVFQGWRPVLGYSTEVIRVARDAATGDLRVTVRDFERGAWRIGATALSLAFHFVRVEAPRAGARLHVTRQQLLDQEALDAGGQSQIGAGDPAYAGELLVLNDAASLQAFWALHDPGQTAPQVDFQRESVIAVLAGFRGSFGHSVETLQAVYDPIADEVRIDFVVHPYRGGAAPPQVTETPFQILRVHRVPTTSIRAEVRQALPIVERELGATAAYQGPEDAVSARTRAAFDAIYGQRVLGGALGGPAALAIDFARDQALFGFLGPRPTTAYGIAIVKAELLEDGELCLLVHHHAPIGRPIAQATSPYQVVSVPRTTGPVRVRFEDVTPRP
jgi:hypothetical protein